MFFIDENILEQYLRGSCFVEHPLANASGNKRYKKSYNQYILKTIRIKSAAKHWFLRGYIKEDSYN